MDQTKPRKFKHPFRHPEHLREMYYFIKQYQKDHGGRPPTRRIIGARFGDASNAVVHYWLLRMEDAGMLRREPNVSCGLVLLPYKFNKEPVHEPILS